MFSLSISVFYALSPELRGKKVMILIESTYLSLGQVAQYYNHSPQMF